MRVGTKKAERAMHEERTTVEERARYMEGTRECEGATRVEGTTVCERAMREERTTVEERATSRERTKAAERGKRASRRYERRERAGDGAAVHGATAGGTVCGAGRAMRLLRPTIVAWMACRPSTAVESWRTNRCGERAGALPGLQSQEGERSHE